MQANKLALVLWIIVCLLVAAGAAYAGSRWFSEPAPLGVPLPTVTPMFELLPQEQVMETNWVDQKIALAFLEYMAPQPDGIPPLRWAYHSDMADFNLKHPHGSEMTSMGSKDENGVVTDCWTVFHYGWPVSNSTYKLVPRKANESVTDFTARFEHSLITNERKLIGNHDPLELPAYCFQHFEYEDAPGEDGKAETHYIFVGPLGKRVLIMNFVCLPGYHEAARPLVRKIMSSFEPGWELKKIMLKEDPDYGELGGSNIGEQEVFLPAAK